jgi:hypothetical protein
MGACGSPRLVERDTLEALEEVAGRLRSTFAILG